MWVCKVGCVLTRGCRAGNQSCLVLYQDNQVLCVIGRGAFIPRKHDFQN